jgi:signal transduction histidine kinase
MHNGTGLGLFIAHKNMCDHGGTIEVKSKVDEGSTFTLTFLKKAR